MQQAVDLDLFLYPDDTSLLFQHKDLEQIKEELIKNSSNIYDWFVNNKLNIHFGRIKLILSFSLPKTEKRKLELWTYNMVTSKSSKTL